MNQEHATRVAVKLMKLGISQAGITQLLASGDLNEIERQLQFLPFRKAKRPGAFLIEAVRNHYSPPKEFYHAQTQTQPIHEPKLDQDAKLHSGHDDAQSL